MLQPNDCVIVGLSGGADSASLVHYLAENHKGKVVACHINHKLRGDESTRDMEFVKTLCNKLQIPLYVYEVDVLDLAKQTGMGIEECARNVRYEIFDRLNLEQFDGKAKIATAHTQNDNIETVLLNIARGSGLNGLCGIPKQRGNIVRPIIEWTREQVENYCAQNNLEYVIDSTNLSDEYARNRIRHNVIPELFEINNAVLKNVNNMTNSLCDDRDFLEMHTQKAFAKVTLSDGFDAKAISKLHNAIKNRVVAKILEKNGLEVSRQRIDAITEICANEGKINLSGDIYAICKDKKLAILEQTQDNMPQIESLAQIGDNEFLNKTVNLQLCHKDLPNNNNLDFINYIDCDKIKGNLILRNRKDGDKVKLLNKAHTKSLKKLFNEQKIEPSVRSTLVILSDDDGIVWIENFGISARVCVDEKTQRCISINIK
ncbi:MAG: tRNA lysidine(34) synthetase TilS [Oscillospiraceae bacterium]|nr:tRNA lysidine(34) synthetase TilS [Oscillospiraceae bacterium]